MAITQGWKDGPAVGVRNPSSGLGRQTDCRSLARLSLSFTSHLTVNACHSLPEGLIFWV